MSPSQIDTQTVLNRLEWVDNAEQIRLWRGQHPELLSQAL